MADRKFEKGEIVILKNERGYTLATVLATSDNLSDISYVDKVDNKLNTLKVHNSRLFKETEVSPTIIKTLIG